LATKSCWLENLIELHSKPIFFQQNNAKLHIDIHDPAFVKATQYDNFNIHMTNQPPNSLDMNVVDLDFFHAIQSMQHQEAVVTINEVIEIVQHAFKIMSHELTNKVFLSLQACMIECLRVDGNNGYELPHINKNHLE